MMSESRYSAIFFDPDAFADMENSKRVSRKKKVIMVSLITEIQAMASAWFGKRAKIRAARVASDCLFFLNGRLFMRRNIRMTLAMWNPVVAR